MTIQLLVNAVDVTDKIVLDSLRKEDVINDEKDTLRFRTKKYGSSFGFTPVKNQEVTLNVDGTKEFGGLIVSVEKLIQAGNIVVFDVVCSDFSFQLDQKIVNERYDDVAIDLIISDLVTTYASSFTTTNVVISTVIKTMSFNRVSLSQALDKIAEATANAWYVDGDKDIHFFSKLQNSAPFQVTDTNGNYLQDSLILNDDLNQLRNVVIIRGDEERGTERTEIYDADGDQVIFNLGNKYAAKPTVILDTGGGTSTLDIGIDFIDQEEDHEAFWDFQNKYIRFKEATKPSSGMNIEVTGIPLFPVLVQVKDGASILEFGEYQFFKEDKTIKSRAEAISLAEAELTAYKDGVIEGRFSTDVTGLRSGQAIRVNSSLLGIDEQLLIQKVTFRVFSVDRAQWDVELATLKTIGIIKTLQDLIRFREVREFDPDNLLTLVQESDPTTVTDASIVPLATTSPPYEWVDDGTETNPGRWNFATWS